MTEAGELERVLRALDSAGVRYLVVGGVAVVLHGHPRMTADLDLVIGFAAENVRATFSALESLGYRPRVPVTPADLADAAIRGRLVEEKGMTVLSLFSPELPLTEVDVFAELPFDFEAAFARALVADFGSFRVPVASIEDLISMKQRAGRPKDSEDVRVLQALAAERKGRGDG